MTKYKSSLKYCFLIVLIYSLIFQNALVEYFPALKYLDEVISFLYIPLSFFLLFRNRKLFVRKDDVLIFFLLSFIVSIGLYANAKFHFQTQSLILLDLYLFLKFFLTFYFSYALFDFSFITKYSRKIKHHLSIITVSLFLLTLMNYQFHIWPSEYRFGIMINSLFYSHSSVLVAISVFLFALMYLVDKRFKFGNPYFIMLLVLILSSLRFKSMGIALVILAIDLLVRKNGKTLRLKHFLLIVSLVLLMTFDQINYYYVEVFYSARNQLLLKSFEVAKAFFPLGSGFGTYASLASALNYSELYYLFGLSHVHGLTINDTSFVSDTFWPMILGQFGYFGLIAFLAILFLLFKKINASFSYSKTLYLSKILAFAYLIISSTSESAFVHPIAIPLALVLGINGGKNENLGSCTCL